MAFSRVWLVPHGHNKKSKPLLFLQALASAVVFSVFTFTTELLYTQTFSKAKSILFPNDLKTFSLQRRELSKPLCFAYYSAPGLY